MSLSKCKTCNESIASTAKTCPKCGEIDPFFENEIKTLQKGLEEFKKEKIRELIIGVIVIPLFSLGLFSYNKWWSIIIGALLLLSLLLLFISFFVGEDRDFINNRVEKIDDMIKQHNLNKNL